EDRVEDLFLVAEVVIDEPIGDPGLAGDVRHPRAVIAAAREDACRRLQDVRAFLATGTRCGRGLAHGQRWHGGARHSGTEPPAIIRSIASIGVIEIELVEAEAPIDRSDAEPAIPRGPHSPRAPAERQPSRGFLATPTSSGTLRPCALPLSSSASPAARRVLR